MKTRCFRLLLLIVLAVLSSGFAYGRAGVEANVVNFALSGSPDTLDPHKTAGTLTFQTIRSLYDTLVEPDENGVLVPALAESWDVSEDYLTWTFRLREGVTFHNRDTLKAGDVKATFERIVSEEIGSSKASEFSSIESIETPDDRTVVFRLSEPYAPLLSSMASGWGAILPKSLIDAGHDFGAEPVGTGPFKLLEWVRDSRVVLEKNLDYWMRGYPKLDMVVMNIITERSVGVQGVLTGELDVIYNVNAEDVRLLEGNPDVTLQRPLTALVMVLAMNTSRSPLTDLRVRQGINHAIDKQSAMDVAYGGGVIGGTFMDVSDPYYEDYADLYVYDQEKARTLFRQAGLGSDTVLEMALPQNFEPHVRAGELYQDMLEKAGLNVKIRLVDWSTWISDVYRGGNYDLTVIGHTGKLDPDGRLGGYGTESTYVKWANPEAAELIQAGRRAVSFEKRKAIYSRVLEIMAVEVPHVYVGTSYRYIATRSNVSGFRMDSKLDTFDFRYVEKN